MHRLNVTHGVNPLRDVSACSHGGARNLKPSIRRRPQPSGQRGDEQKASSRQLSEEQVPTAREGALAEAHVFRSLQRSHSSRDQDEQRGDGQRQDWHHREAGAQQNDAESHSVHSGQEDAKQENFPATPHQPGAPFARREQHAPPTRAGERQPRLAEPDQPEMVSMDEPRSESVRRGQPIRPYDEQRFTSQRAPPFRQWSEEQSFAPRRPQHRNWDDAHRNSEFRQPSFLRAARGADWAEGQQSLHRERRETMLDGDRFRIPPLPPHLRSSARAVAVQQLIRIAEEGAFAGLVNGSPVVVGSPRAGTGTGQQRLPPVPREELFFHDDEDSSRLWDSYNGPQPVQLTSQDERMVKNLVSSVTRLKRRLDFVISDLTATSAAKLEPAMREVLRLGIYELSEKGMAPHALNEHVDIAKALVRPSAAAFANGVLRNAARLLEDGRLPDPQIDIPGVSGRDLVRKLAIVHSHPTWLVTRWVNRWGPALTEQLLRSNNRLPTYGCRINTSRGLTAASCRTQLEDLGVAAEPSEVLPRDFLRVQQGLQTMLEQGFVARGDVYVQDEAAGLVVALLDPRPGDRILDCCAAPGGKTLFAAARLQGQGSVTAMDISSNKLKALKCSAQAAGLQHVVRPVAADLRTYLTTEWDGSTTYDKVLLDAPCSGTGVLAKRSDLRWRRQPEELAQLIALQDQMLDVAAQLVRPGGVLVYSTCSIEEEEGGDRVRAFLERHQGQFVLDHPLESAAAAAVGQVVPASPSHALSAARSSTAGTASSAHDSAGKSSQNSSSPDSSSSTLHANPWVEEGYEASVGETEKLTRQTGAGPMDDLQRTQQAATSIGAGPRTAGGVPLCLINAEGCLAILPHLHGMDGAFAARMVRVAGGGM